MTPDPQARERLDVALAALRAHNVKHDTSQHMRLVYAVDKALDDFTASQEPSDAQ